MAYENVDLIMVEFLKDGRNIWSLTYSEGELEPSGVIPAEFESIKRQAMNDWKSDPCHDPEAGAEGASFNAAAVFIHGFFKCGYASGTDPKNFDMIYEIRTAG